MLLYKVASFVVIDFENGVDYISFSVFDFSALKNGTEYSFVNDQFQVNDYTDVTFIKDKSGTAYTEATLDAFISTIKVIDDPNIGNLPAGGTTGQILAKIDGTDYNAEWIDNLLDEVNPICKLGENISKGQAVYVSGADGTNKIIKKASNATELTSSKTFGLLSATGVTNNKIRVITTGYLSGLDTSSATEGDPVWLGVNGDLIYGYTNKPHAPAHLVFIGIVVRSNNVNGQIYVRVQNGFELDELHDVKIQSPANKNTIFYNSSNSLWENRLIGIADVTDLESSLYSKIEGSGSINFLPKFSGSKTLSNSLIYDDGTRVGIGTTITNELLTINGSIDLQYGSYLSFQGGITPVTSKFAIKNTYSSPYDVLMLQATGNSDGIITFHTGSAAATRVESMRLNSYGYLGIGTKSPEASLTVQGATTIIGQTRVSARFSDNYESTLLISHPASSGNTATITGNNQLAFATGTVGSIAERMRITSGGNVGIGTTNPTNSSGYATLTVGGGSGLLGQITWNSGSTAIGYAYNDGTNMNIGSNSDLVLRTTAGASERMRITSAGNIGIGTSSTDPSAILHLKSTTQGFLPPRMDNTEINAISNPAEGLIVYSTQSKCLFLFDGAGWQKIAFA